MNRFSKLFLFILTLVLFYSCASNKALEVSLNPVYVTNTKKVLILPPADIENKLDSQQVLTGSFGKQSFTLQAYIYADETSLELSLFNDFGTDMGSLFYDGNSASFSSAVFPPELKPEYVICDFQNAYYKFEALEENYQKFGLTFVQEKTENGEIRKVLSGKKVIEEILISESEVKINNLLRGYKYNLIPVEF